MKHCTKSSMKMEKMESLYSEFIDFVFPAHPEKDEHINRQEQERMRLEAEKIRNVTPGTLSEAMLIEKIKASLNGFQERQGHLKRRLSQV